MVKWLEEEDFVQQLKAQTDFAHTQILICANSISDTSKLQTYILNRDVDFICKPLNSSELKLRLRLAYEKSDAIKQKRTIDGEIATQKIADAKPEKSKQPVFEDDVLQTILGEDKDKYRMIIENAGESILLIQHGRIIFSNPATTKMLGFSFEELSGAEFVSFLHPDDKTEVIDNHHQRLKGNTIPLYQTRVVTNKGEYVHVEVKAARFEYDGQPAAVGFLTDVSDKLKVESALKENEERYRLFFDKSIEPICIISAQTFRFLDVNEAFTQLYGYSKEELLQKSVKDISAQKDLSESAIKETVKSGSIIIPSRKHRKKDGTVMNVRISAGPFVWKGEKVLYAIVRDVTEQLLLEQEVKDSKELLQNMADSMSAYVGVADAETIKYKFVNQRFVEAFQKKRSDIIGAYYADVMGIENANFAMKYINKVRAGKAASYINTFGLASGKRWINVNFTPSFNSEGEVKDIIILSHDITKQKQAELDLQHAKEQLEIQNGELRELNATKNKFFSIIAHDLKSPFNALLGIGSLLKENLKNNDLDGAEAMADLMYDSASNSFELLENLLNWSRVQISRMKINPKQVKLQGVVDEVIQLYNVKAVQKKIQLKECSQNDIEAYIDEDMISSVLRNLVSNAIKYTKQNGVISIDLSIEKGKTQLVVSDTGVGMNQQRLENLFKAESCYTTAGTDNEQGTGLGLILCHEFVHLNKGEISVSSEPGIGTTFKVVLPLSKT
ncbi:PAS domain-containing sensor histidine kinase [Carboxylicivirga sp. M1479]|uniref:PAS domain-containing sensor histidine kinase n=1 Tax=Carboxylicivirga sp. M1479 TaxID=2594476 RepID=UPI00117847A7|nr:PAS domain-containing sensor histidine kinase [Carboxylicivirga sp. M1479]TRX71401.1 PAS domain-containing sensor histidine kinase [Carboxylicivirga sp. M1479]